MPPGLVAGALAVAVACGRVPLFLCASAGGPPPSLAVAAEELPCSQGPAAAALSRGDVSQARAELAAYKDAPRVLRDCASAAWKRGVEALASAAAAEASWGTGDAPRASRVLERLGGDRCAARVEDGTWLDIPRLQEVLVCVHAGERVLVLEQDGFLRAFDMPTVLWPAGYFLALWATAHCGLLGGRVLELGAGVGAPSIAASLCGGNTVVATDKALHGLVNARTNALINGASVATRPLDWDSDADVDALAASGAFDVVLGAGLAPHRWAERLCGVLVRLLRPRGGRAVLAHGAGDVDPAGSCLGRGALAVERVVPGDEYGLRTRWGAPSEFELVVVGRVDAGDL
mmetsp:Transcript_20145/g.63885  ORF Transcript_20145/g.63885 Transcript_20145/m.63885 type:complete len:345 (+) Transcript_20145:26-1060(+)